MDSGKLDVYNRRWFAKGSLGSIGHTGLHKKLTWALLSLSEMISRTYWSSLGLKRVQILGSIEKSHYQGFTKVAWGLLGFTGDLGAQEGYQGNQGLTQELFWSSRKTETSYLFGLEQWREVKSFRSTTLDFLSFWKMRQTCYHLFIHKYQIK